MHKSIIVKKKLQNIMIFLNRQKSAIKKILKIRDRNKIIKVAA